MEQQPDITVTIMSYNNAAFVAQTVESVLNQVGVSFELIVIDDKSTDETLAVLERYLGDPRFTLRINEVNLGAVENFNRCVESGAGRYVVVLGSDDIIYPGHLQLLLEALEQCPNAALAYSQCHWIDEHGNPLRHAVHPGHTAQSYFGGRDEVVDLLRFDNYITPSAVMLRRSVLETVRQESGVLARKDFFAGDWELWTRIARSHRDFVFVQTPSVGYRVHANQESQTFYRSEHPIRDHTALLEENLDDPATRKRMRHAAMEIWALFLNRVSSYPDEVQQRYWPRARAIRNQLFGNELSQTALEVSGSRPYLSVILTVEEDLMRFGRTLEDIAGQTWRDLEIVVVNNHGYPAEQIVRASRLPIKYTYLPARTSIDVASEVGRRLALGRYILHWEDTQGSDANLLANLAEHFSS